MHHFKLADYSVGIDYPPIFLCEIGSHYNGDINEARSMVEAIVAAHRRHPNVPFILKTEILNNADICLKEGIEERYVDKKGIVKTENFRALIERKVMPLEHYAELFKLLNEEKMPFIISVYDFEAVDFSMSQGACALKIASANIVHIPLIRYAAKQGVPLIIDTGRSSIAEVYRAIDTARAAGCQHIIVEHSPDGHPALPEAHNLRILETYQQCFNLPVGLSDHSTGLEMMYLSIALGARIIEKGVSFHPEILDQDISHAMGIDQLDEVLEKIYDCWIALGATERDTRKLIKGNIGTSQRPGLIAKYDLNEGDVITQDSVSFAFPCKGIPVEMWDNVQNWRISQSVVAGRPIEWKHVTKENVTESA